MIKEAFNYCVEVTYPLTAGFEDVDEDTVFTQQVGLDGAASCSLALQAQSTTDKLARPLWNVMWSWTRSNPIFAMVLIFIIIVGIAIWAKTKR
jgi:hypothetical protein